MPRESLRYCTMASDALTACRSTSASHRASELSRRSSMMSSSSRARRISRVPLMYTSMLPSSPGSSALMTRSVVSSMRKRKDMPGG